MWTRDEQQFLILAQAWLKRGDDAPLLRTTHLKESEVCISINCDDFGVAAFDKDFDVELIGGRESQRHFLIVAKLPRHHVIGSHYQPVTDHKAGRVSVGPPIQESHDAIERVRVFPAEFQFQRDGVTFVQFEGLNGGVLCHTLWREAADYDRAKN